MNLYFFFGSNRFRTKINMDSASKWPLENNLGSNPLFSVIYCPFVTLVMTLAFIRALRKWFDVVRRPGFKSPADCCHSISCVLFRTMFLCFVDIVLLLLVTLNYLQLFSSPATKGTESYRQQNKWGKQSISSVRVIVMYKTITMQCHSYTYIFFK